MFWMNLDKVEVTPKSHDDWLNMRKDDLTSTDISALFGASPYQTRFGLWHEKKSKKKSNFVGNERTVFGRLLEPVIGKAASEVLGVQGEPYKVYGRIPSLRLGASFDWRFPNPKTKEFVLMEIKNVDTYIFQEQWYFSKQEEIEIEKFGDKGLMLQAPTHIELQCQHQMLVSGIKNLCLAVFVGGNKIHIANRHALPEVQKKIIDAASMFWNSINENNEPPALPEDADNIIEMNQEVDKGTIHPKGEDIHPLAIRYEMVSKNIKELELRKKNLKAKILTKMGTHAKVKQPQFSISANWVKASYIEYNRGGYRDFRIYWKKGRGK